MEAQHVTRTARTGEVAKALGLAVTTIRGYAREGRIPATPTPGGQYRFDPAEVWRVLHPTSPVALQAPARFVSVFASGATAVEPGSTDALSSDVLAESARSGYHRETVTGEEAAAEVAASPRVRQRAISERQRAVGEQHRATRRAAQVLVGAPVAAFSVLR